MEKKVGKAKRGKKKKGTVSFPLALRKCLHERAVSACCLSEPLWVAYAHFASSRDYDLDVHARAVRNCPWSSPLWTSYMRALERSGATYERILAAFRGGSRRVASDASALLDVAMSYCEWCRRNAPERLKSAFAKARRTVEAAFPGWSAGSIALQKYEAHCEAHVLKNPDAVRGIYESAMRGNGLNVALWMDYVSAVRSMRDLEASARNKWCRSIFKRA